MSTKDLRQLSGEQLLKKALEHSQQSQPTEEALPILDEIIRRTQSKAPLPILTRCTHLIQLERYEEAIKDAYLILKLKDDKLPIGETGKEVLVKGSTSFHSAAYARLHLGLCKLNKMEEAGEMLKKRAEVEKVNQELYQDENLIVEKEGNSKNIDNSSKMKLKKDINNNSFNVIQNSKEFDRVKDQAKFYFQKKEYNKALKTFQLLLDMNSSDAITHTNLAACYYHLKDVKNAMYHSKQALNLDPTYMKAYHWLGKVYLLENKDRLALECFEKCKHMLNEKELRIEPTLLELIESTKTKINKDEKIWLNTESWLYWVLLLVGCVLCLFWLM